jgi:methanol--5-hydroxybenzimidazolylcobamide Co-methyltransferase
MVGFAGDHGVKCAGDTACGLGHTAMVLGEHNMIPRVVAAIERAVPAVRSLVAYECGAVGPGKDRDYESSCLRAITCFSMAIEGTTSVCALLSEMGNLAAAYCDNWSNESVQNIKLLGGMAATCYIEQLVCDCRSMNTASGDREEFARQFQRWLVKPDIAINPQAFILSPESTVKPRRAIVYNDSHDHSGVAAARKAVKPLCIARSQGKLQFEPNEADGFGKLQYSQGEQQGNCIWNFLDIRVAENARACLNWASYDANLLVHFPQKKRNSASRSWLMPPESTFRPAICV